MLNIVVKRFCGQMKTDACYVEIKWPRCPSYTRHTIHVIPFLQICPAQNACLITRLLQPVATNMNWDLLGLSINLVWIGWKAFRAHSEDSNSVPGQVSGTWTESLACCACNKGSYKVIAGVKDGRPCRLRQLCTITLQIVYIYIYLRADRLSRR